MKENTVLEVADHKERSGDRPPRASVLKLTVWILMAFALSALIAAALATPIMIAFGMALV